MPLLSSRLIVKRNYTGYNERMKALLLLFLFLSFPLYAAEFYVSPTGSDRTGAGTADKPWATLGAAVRSVPDDGSTLILKDGVYAGFQMWSRRFEKGLIIKAEHPYHARLTSRKGTNRVLYLEKLSKVIFDGLEFFGNGGTEGDYLIQLGAKDVHHLVFQNCIIHDSYKNDLIKINNGTHHIRFTNCVFFNPNNHGGDEHFDINSVQDIAVEESIFFNDYPGSGRQDINQSHSFIVIKNSGAKEAVTRNIALSRNVFLNWAGLSDQAFILLGEDGRPFFEASNVLIENNLLLHHSAPRIVAAFLFKGGIHNVMVRANTVSGVPNGGAEGAFSAYSAVFQRIGENPPQENVMFANNIFSNNAGTMRRFSAGKKECFKENSFTAVNNIYWNGGKEIPAAPEDIFVPQNDPKKILKSPELPDVPKEMVLPRFDSAKKAFPSGNTTIRQEFESLVNRFAVPAQNSAAVDRADAALMPQDDILGRNRGEKPDAGCCERP
ncbi:MAG: hypothetical protein LBN39_04815 [Planctomycetaceae bacterium]|jgi:hypothetical protein|nr:hypothetical protein [Planctomycetaceae bacterium]